MKRKIFCMTLILVVSLMMVKGAPDAFAGWVQAELSGDMTYFSEGKVKSTSGEDDSWSVIDGSSRTITMVSPGKKSYAVLTVDELCAFISKMMSGMTAEQKAMFEAMKKEQHSKGFKMKKAGPGGKVAGYSTDKYRIDAGDARSMEVWVSTDKNLNSVYRKLTKKAKPLMDKMASCSAMGGGGMEVENSKEYRKLEEKGWVLKRVAKGKVGSETEVEKIEQKEIPASEFKVPAGYKKVSIEQFYGG